MQRSLFLFMLFLITILSVTHIHAAKKNARDEQILKFDSQLIVNSDATLDVTEQLLLYADQRKIRHGLVRWLPMNYMDSRGIKHQTKYKLLDAQMDNKKIPYHVEQRKDQFVIYLGQRDTALASGEHTVTLRYHVKDSVSFLANQDQLFWNITGHSWDYPILKASATFVLPQQANITNYTAFTGKMGSDQKNYLVTRPAPNQITFTTTRPLLRRDGFSIEMGWPKGIVQKPMFIGTIPLYPSDSFFVLKILGMILGSGLLIWIIYKWLQRKALPLSSRIIMARSQDGNAQNNERR